MFFELVGTLVAGIGMAGVAMLLNRLTGRRLPAWLPLAAAGAGMLSMAIWSEYSWYGRTVAGMPEGLEIATTDTTRQAYRPWTYVAPVVTRLWAVDTATMRSHPAQDGQYLAEVYVMARWKPVRHYPVLADCPGGALALVTPEVEFGSDGSVEGAVWNQPGPEDPVLATACNGRG